MDKGCLPLEEFMKIFSDNANSLLKLNQRSLSELKDIYVDLLNPDNSITVKGKLLEKFIFCLFSGSYDKLVQCLKNARTSTNEMDILFSLTTNAQFLRFDEIFFHNMGFNFICECKNYNSRVGVTYIGKFYSLLKVSGVKLGLFVSFNGITGQNDWEDAKGLIHKIALKDDIYIIVLDKNDLFHLQNNTIDIFTLIKNKISCLKLDIDYSQFISQHENETNFLM